MAEENKSLVWLLNNLKNKKLKMIVSRKTIKRLNEIYKKNYAFDSNFLLLEEKFKDCKEALEKSPAAYCEIKKQYEKNMALQSSILTECFIAQTLANSLGLNQFADIDNKNAKIPVQISNILFQQKNKKDGASFRYIYFNDSYDKVLVQCGDSSTIDAVFIKEKIGVRIEVKEEDSKANEADIPKYDGNGKLVLTKTFKEKYPYYVPFVEIFNKKTDVFTMMGHNFNIVEYLDKDSFKRAIDGIISDKFIDLYIFQKDDFIIPIAAKDLFSSVGFSGSEIRTAGRNDKKLWLVDFAKSEIVRLGGKIENGKVYLPLDEKMYTIGRGKDVVTRYKINSLLFVRIADWKVEDGVISFGFEKIRQLKPSISFHLNPL